MQKKINSLERQLFIGIVNFYDVQKEYGFILTNSFGMNKLAGLVNPTKIFFTKGSIKELDTNNLSYEQVVFNLVVSKGKVKAINVRRYDYSKYKKLALSYCIYMNNIYSERRVKRMKKHYCITRYEWVTEKETISVFSYFDVRAIDVLKELVELQKKTGDDEVKKRFDYILSNVWKNTNYFSFISKDSDNAIKQESKRLLECLNPQTSAELVFNHPRLICIVNDQVVQEYNNITKRKTEIKIEDIIFNRTVLNSYYDKNDKRKLKNNTKVSTPYLLRLVALCSEEKQQGYIKKITEIMKESVISYVDNELNKCNTGEVLNFIKYYSQFVDSSAKNRMAKIYDEKVVKDFYIIFHPLHHISDHNLYNIYEEYNKLTEKQKILASQYYKDYYLKCASLTSITNDSIDEFVNKIPVPKDSWKTDACDVIIERANERIDTLLNSKDWEHDINIGIFREGINVKEVLPKNRIEYYIKYSNDLLFNDCPLRLLGNAIKLDFIDESTIDINSVLTIRNLSNIVDKGNFNINKFDYSADLIVGKIKDYINNYGVLFRKENHNQELYLNFLKCFAERNQPKLAFLPSCDKLELLSRDIVVPISIDEIKDELLNIGPQNCSETLFNHQHTPEAICRIISSYSKNICSDSSMDEIKEWVKLLLLTNKQNKIDKDLFFNVISRIPFNSDSFDCGVNLEKREFIPTINDFSPCYKFISSICRYIKIETFRYDYNSSGLKKIEFNHPHLIVPTSYFTEDELQILIRNLGCNIINKSTDSVFVEASFFKINEEDLVIPYLVTRVLFEHFKQEVLSEKLSFKTCFPIDTVRTREYYQMVSNVIGMHAWSGKSILYRVGDRDSYVDVGDCFSVEFTKPIDFRIYYLFKRIQSKLVLSEEKDKISYSDIYSYGTWSTRYEYEYDNTEEYKSKLVSPMITTLFYTYMIGC